MRILQLCLRVPYPPRDGATIAMYNLSESLIAAGASVKTLAFNTKKSFIADEEINPQYKQAVNLQTVFLDATINPKDAFLNFFKKNESYNIKRFYSKDFENALINILKAYVFDVVQLEGLFMSPYVDVIRKYSNAKITMRAHNVEFVIWQRLADAATNPVKKKYLSFLAKRLKQYERKMLNSYDAVVPLTTEDASLLKAEGCTLPMFLLPIGIETKKYNKAVNVSAFNMFHLGSMDWMPNIEAVDWFLNNVWEQLKRDLPEIKLHLAGSSMPERIKKLADKNLMVYDRIDDAKKFMLDKPVMIVPLLSGGGMRVKIIEGLAAGKIIISTKIGAEGIKYTHGKNILIANTPAEFINEIKKIYNNTQLRYDIGHQAQYLAQSDFDNDVLGKKLFNFYKELISQ